jgi:hypothetical protein
MLLPGTPTILVVAADTARRTAAALALAALLGGTMVGPAAAAPVNGHNAIQFTLDCGLPQPLVIVSPSSSALAGQLVDQSGNTVTHGGDLTVTNLTTGDSHPSHFTSGAANGKGLADDLLTCAVDQTFQDPHSGDLIHLEGVFYVTLVPRR